MLSRGLACDRRVPCRPRVRGKTGEEKIGYGGDSCQNLETFLLRYNTCNLTRNKFHVTSSRINWLKFVW